MIKHECASDVPKSATIEGAGLFETASVPSRRPLTVEIDYEKNLRANNETVNECDIFQSDATQPEGRASRAGHSSFPQSTFRGDVRL